jgi:hypothetical protein
MAPAPAFVLATAKLMLEFNASQYRTGPGLAEGNAACSRILPHSFREACEPAVRSSGQKKIPQKELRGICIAG